MIVSLAVGFYYFVNAFLPILVWYIAKKDSILAIQESNIFYVIAWYTMMSAHWVVFLPMALLWPLTYLGNQVVTDFYDLANWWLGSIVAGITYSTIAVAFTLSAIFYEDNTYTTRNGILSELTFYLLIEAFAWYTSVWEYPVAHYQFYYAANRYDEVDEQDDNKEDINSEELLIDEF